MKRLITSAVALTLIVGAPAMAQDRDKQHGGGKHDNAQQQNQNQNQGQKHQGGGGGGHQNRADRPDNGGPNPNAGGGLVNPSYRNPNGPRADQNNDNRNFDRNRNLDRGQNFDRRNDNRGQNLDRRNDRNPNWDRRNVDRGQNWNRRDRPRQFDRRAYQRNTWAQRRFHRGFYQRPNGWYYRRWAYGQILPFIFFSQNYWLNDWYDYGLPIPPYGYEWVQYGNDAILVDVRTGTILQVVYGVFY